MGFDGVIVYKCGCIVDGYDIPAACPIHHVAGTYSDRKPKRGGQPMNLDRVLERLNTILVSQEQGCLFWAETAHQKERVRAYIVQ